ncbi:EAL domain, c-di-GMP-specific phosphodiesterase class I (Or its enzymatically inactive variant) [Nitrosomonas nitrosa]|uniref:EAL domain, c-di-GMP-specific phosphodiesterase class I (Or its enzymatically inactive variant) n=1 Tax=Nitrosomonas nitrosa TaxID=52442 RepID=A0A8H8Z124_9PROT|nr:EAL domain-containing protein [Nitrosomonas nitrosa]CAE6507400.1 EAL domain, c-di-GMP-specific phosphodiesterase class I (Or its enzymatically inactive variant) [Nitrosomonas nitrosa]
MNASITNTFIAKDKFELIQSTIDYPLEQSDDGWISGRFFHHKITSVFQPIINATQNKTLGHIAYILSEGEITLSPWQAFAKAANDEELANLDSLCRTIHILNYFNKANSSYKLFVEVHPRLLESAQSNHNQTFEDLLNLIGVKTSRVVIEIPPIINRNWKLLQKMIDNYRSHGYQIAATYYKGSSSNWMSDLCNLYPDIVRIKASYLLYHHIINTIIRATHSSGIRILVCDIGAYEQLLAARRSGADYLQGDFLSKPTRAIHAVSPRFTP